MLETTRGASDVLGGFSDVDILIVSSIDDAEKRFAADASLRLSDVELAGRHHSTNETVSIQGVAIDDEQDLEGESAVSTYTVESVAATQNFVPASEVRADLLGRLMNLGLVPALLTERLHAEEIVDAFLRGAGVAPDVEADWTTRRATRAEFVLVRLVRAAYAVNDRQPSYVWDPMTLMQPRPRPGQINDWYAPFVVHEWYGGWSKNAEHASSFDSNTGEFAFATLADQSDDIRSWLRPYTTDPAWITLYPSGRYFPDFIVIDNGGHWLIEAKSDAAAINDLQVAAKRAAAGNWVEAVGESKLFGTWRYLLVTETGIRQSSNWKALVSRLN
ncbi:MAG: hypothetical protein ACYCZY_04445 [Lacisediminihabitans sp.]